MTSRLFARLLFAVTLLFCTDRLRAQTYQVIHTFSGGGDGGNPVAGVTIDHAGNFYGTASTGGSCSMGDCGTVFKLARHGSGWLFTPIYSFHGAADGQNPSTRIAIAPDGTLFGATAKGGRSYGTAYQLRPPLAAPRSALVTWSHSVLHSFYLDDHDVATPQGDLAIDSAGNVYGTGQLGCTNNNGGTYELTRSGGSWSETMIYCQSGPADAQASGGVILDRSGKLYGVLTQGGPSPHLGTIYQLTPSGSAWTSQTIYSFSASNLGIFPFGGLVMDAAGNLYGTTETGGTGGGGTIYELSPSDGGWTHTVLYNFPGCAQCGPKDKLRLDAAGNIYGTTYSEGAHGWGSVFKLTHSGSQWIYSTLHDFTGGDDGGWPISTLTMDASGNLWGTASAGGH
jgi:uncharacterized repeat protein (TIGR03803 family)